MRVGELARPFDEVPIARPEELVTELLARLDSTSLPRALVRDATEPLGEILGVVTPEDVSRAIAMGQLRAPAVGDTSTGRGASHGQVLP